MAGISGEGTWAPGCEPRLTPQLTSTFMPNIVFSIDLGALRRSRIDAEDDGAPKRALAREFAIGLRSDVSSRGVRHGCPRKRRYLRRTVLSRRAARGIIAERQQVWIR